MTFVWYLSVTATVLHLIRHLYSYYAGMQRAGAVEKLLDQVNVNIDQTNIDDNAVDSMLHTLVQKVDLSQLESAEVVLKMMAMVRQKAPQVRDLSVSQGIVEALLNNKAEILELITNTQVTAEGLTADGKSLLPKMRERGYTAVELKDTKNPAFQGQGLKDLGGFQPETRL